MAKHYLIAATPAGVTTKSLTLDTLPDAAWTPILGSGAGDDLTELYAQVPWLYRAVNLRADALANLPHAWETLGGDPLPGEPRLPFPLDLPYLLNLLEGWLVLYGAAYIFKGLNAARRVKTLRPLHPRTVTPVIEPERGLVAFERQSGADRLTLDLHEIIYLWLPSRRAELGHGTPPAQAALAAAGMLKAADQFADTYFRQGALMPTLISIDGMPPASEMEKLEHWAARAMTGLGNAFRTIALRAQVKVQPLSANVELGRLALPELTDKKREDIATALGVPHSLLFSNAANYATARQDDLHFYDKTILPEARRIEAALNAQLFAHYSLRLRFRPDQMEIYQEREAQKADKLAALADAEVITPAAARAQLDLQPPSPPS
jgi:HK97 family phage portal protein